VDTNPGAWLCRQDPSNPDQRRHHPSTRGAVVPRGRRLLLGRQKTTPAAILSANPPPPRPANPPPCRGRATGVRLAWHGKTLTQISAGNHQTCALLTLRAGRHTAVERFPFLVLFAARQRHEHQPPPLPGGRGHQQARLVLQAPRPDQHQLLQTCAGEAGRRPPTAGAANPGTGGSFRRRTDNRLPTSPSGRWTPAAVP